MSQSRKRTNSASNLEDGRRQSKAVALTQYICDRSRSIPWSSTAREIPKASRKIIAKVPESHGILQQSTCRLCQVLAAIKPPSLDGKTCSLAALSARRTLAWTTIGKLNEMPWDDTTLLGVFPSGRRSKYTEGGYLGVLDASKQHFDIGPREIEPHKIDFGVVKEWLTFCCENHLKSCSPKSRTIPG
jgi:hypothetical protein